ncbi:MAG: hypothetical protein PUH24_10050 [Prevotellaceae bacterium]|nr:hypothetical protein [Prevotellaceae bacterium]MDY6130014.1 hypothetical protein [Prevotella sp.]
MIKFKEKQEKNSLQVSSVSLSLKEHLRNKLKKSLMICLNVGRTEKRIMKPLDISAINLNAPYSVWNVADYYHFVRNMEPSIK